YLCADVQQNETLYCVCRAFAANGDSRLIWCGRLIGFEALREKQQELKVQDSKVVIDSGYNAADVYAACLRFKWVPCKGEEQDYFAVTDSKGNQKRTLWKTTVVDPHYGTSQAGKKQLRLILWATHSVMDRLDRLMKRKSS